MIRYDKIWVPEKKQGFEFRDKDGDTPSIVSGPVVVISIEELEKMLYFFFKEGESLGSECERKDAFAKLQSPDFKKTFSNYLQSKGISLIDSTDGTEGEEESEYQSGVWQCKNRMEGVTGGCPKQCEDCKRIWQPLFPAPAPTEEAGKEIGVLEWLLGKIAYAEGYRNHSPMSKEEHNFWDGIIQGFIEVKEKLEDLK